MSGTAPERVLSMEEMARLNEMGEVVTQGQNLSPEDKESLTRVTDELSHVGKVVVQPDKQILCVPDPKPKGEEGSERLQLQLHQYSDSLQGISDHGSTSGTALEGGVLSMEELVVTEGPDFFPQDEESLTKLTEDLSGIDMHTLPQYIFGLVALQKLILRNCEILMMELPPEIGDLKNLEVLDLEGTEILCLPMEIAKLVNLTCLKVSFYGHANQTVIPKTVLSNLSRLKELIIDVTPYGEWWDVEVKDIIDDLCNLKELTTLQLSLPTAELLEDLTLMLPGLANFRFTVGRHEEHFISRLPRNVEEEFNNREKLEKGLKFINGNCIPNEITKVLKHANAFFLQRHWTAESLSEFGHENLNEVKFFLVMECNEFRTIIDSEKLYQGKDERAESEDFPDFDEAMVLGSLQRLIIRYMKHMESIWKGPVGKGSLSNLKSLALHTCPKLTTLFTIDMLNYLTNLEELIVEDCPKINSLVSHQNAGSKSVHFLPSLKKISLLHLPGLVSISSGQGIAPKLERMVVFYCPKLEKLSATEVSSTELKVIKGDKEWWDALKWYESDLSTEDEDYLACLFIPLRKDGDLMAQLTEDEIAGYGQGEVGSDCLSNFSEEQLLEEISSEDLEEIPSEEFEEIRSEELEETPSNPRELEDVSQLESISEDASVSNKRHNPFDHFIPTLRSGEWSNIGGRSDMEDTHICITDLAKTFGYKVLGEEAISFYGVFDGHGGKGAAQFVRDHLPRVIVEDADFPLELEKVVTRSFLETDAAFAKSCTLDSALSSGTTALTAMIFGRSLLVANAGDCRAVLSRCGIAIEMSKDHRPCRDSERIRIESLGGYIDDGYLNGQMSVSRALGDWHMNGFKKTKSGMDGPLSAEPELKLLTLTKEDEFVIIGSDGMWDVFGSQNAVDFARRRLQEHNDVKKCCKEIVEEAIKRHSLDNVTVVMVCFHSEPPPPMLVQRPKVKQNIFAEGLQNLRFLLEG